MFNAALKAIATISVTTLIAGVAIAAPPPVTLQNLIKEKVGAQLLDEMSAQYRWPSYSPDGVSYCGFVNGKNAYGGYAGFRPFYIIVTGSAAKGYELGQPIVLTSSGDALDDIMYGFVKDSCAKAGIDVRQIPPK